jgi:hypothetical protein
VKNGAVLAGLRWTQNSQISAAGFEVAAAAQVGTRTIGKHSGFLKIGQNGSLLNWR